VFSVATFACFEVGLDLILSSSSSEVLGRASIVSFTVFLDVFVFPDFDLFGRFGAAI